MIPHIIHQTWKDAEIPQEFSAYVESWKHFHPGWQFRLWTDADLSLMVAERYPEYRDLFNSYEQPIMRADVGRYLVLREYGGVYADLDAEAVASIAPLVNADAPTFAYEPSSHATLAFVRSRGFTRVVSNAVMLSPAGHPFWDDLLALLLRCRHAKSPLDATGPFVLTAAVERAPVEHAPRLLPAHVFSPRDKFGEIVDSGDSDQKTLVSHHWAGTWWTPRASVRAVTEATLAAEHPHRMRDIAEAARFRLSIDHARLGKAKPRGDEILLAVPVRDAVQTLDCLFAGLLSLTHAREKMSIAFMEGDSGDDSHDRLLAFAQRNSPGFRRIKVFKHDLGSVTPVPRWAPNAQRSRRSHIAKVRNMLVKEALQHEDWVLWIDADIIGFPNDIISTLLAAEARIVHPNAVRIPGGPSMDLNAWVIERPISPAAMAEWIKDGLYQPPAGFQRLYLSDLRYRDSVALDSVGGTMLLVDANLHRAGLLFPEAPYRYLIETEGFGMAARDMGIVPLGLPNVEVIHAPR